MTTDINSDMTGRRFWIATPERDDEDGCVVVEIEAIEGALWLAEGEEPSDDADISGVTATAYLHDDGRLEILNDDGCDMAELLTPADTDAVRRVLGA